MGTSPRMRGKPQHWCWSRIIRRNIPAYAGKTAVKSDVCDRYPEHPRVCGENAVSASVRAGISGTSPRMRGKPTPSHPPTRSKGNIPAYAGKTVDPLQPPGRAQEHPRVCGENRNAPYRIALADGTSPRMRGKLRWRTHYSRRERNIPAYAGKT